MTRAYNTATTQQNSGGVLNPFAAGKNKIINGDMNVWQRGTSLTGSSDYVYGADRFRSYAYASTSTTVSRQAFTAGNEIAGYEPTYFMRINSTNTGVFLEQPIEDVRTFAGQTATLSFWAKAASAHTLTVQILQYFGSGGSATVTTNLTSQSITTSWARYTATVSVPSISGKTIGTNNGLYVRLTNTSTNNNFDIWGVQLEAGSVATPFQTATGTIQGELAACQRYFEQVDIVTQRYWLTGYSINSSGSVFTAPMVSKRSTPTITVTGAGTAKILAGGGSEYTITSYTPTMLPTYSNSFMFQANVSSGTTGGQANTLYASGGAVSFQFSSEL